MLQSMGSQRVRQDLVTEKQQQKLSTNAPLYIGFPGGTKLIKSPPPSAENIKEASSILELGRSSGRENDNPLQYSCLEISKDRRAWQADSPWGHKGPDTTEHTQALT